MFLDDKQKYVSVTDDWYPCIYGNKVLVKLKVMILNSEDKKMRYGKDMELYSDVHLVVTGNDDFYMEKRYSIFKIKGSDTFIEHVLEDKNSGTQLHDVKYQDTSHMKYINKTEEMYRKYLMDWQYRIHDGFNKMMFKELGLVVGI